MDIGGAARAQGASAKMIRHCEATGLIPAAGRNASGYRVYSATEVRMLRFIRPARDMGFSAEGIAELLALWRDRGRQSADVKKLALAQVADLRRRIRAMEEMVGTLEHLAERCHGDHSPDCPILADLEAGTSQVGRGHCDVPVFGRP